MSARLDDALAQAREALTQVDDDPFATNEPAWWVGALSGRLESLVRAVEVERGRSR